MNEFFFQKKIYYRVNTFSKNRKSLVFIHGLSGCSSSWIKYEDNLKEKYNILAIDIRGHGKSFRPKGRSEYRISRFSDDIFDLLKYLKIEKSILISHSLGTLIALDMVKRQPSLFSGLVFISPIFKANSGIAPKLVNLFNKIAVNSGIAKVLNRPRGKHIYYGHYINSGDWNVPRMFADITNTGLAPFFYSMIDAYSIDFSDFLESIKIPTVIIHGSKDTISPVKNAIIMHNKINNSRLEILENSNHILVLNNYKEVREIVDNFADGIDE